MLIQPDLGTSLVFGAIVFGALFCRRCQPALADGRCLAHPRRSCPIAWNLVLKDYQKQRLISFLDPTADPLGSGYQLQQSQIAVELRRPVRPRPHERHHRRPVPAGRNRPTSSSRAWARSSGFLGGALVLVLFALLIWRVLLVGWRSEDLFILAFSGGIAGMLLFQMIVNVGMVLGVMPITGIPLPVRDPRRCVAHQRGPRPGHPREPGDEAQQPDLTPRLGVARGSGRGRPVGRSHATASP